MTDEGFEVAIRALEAGYFDEPLFLRRGFYAKPYARLELGSAADFAAVSEILAKLSEIVPDHGMDPREVSPPEREYRNDWVERIRAKDPRAAKFVEALLVRRQP